VNGKWYDNSHHHAGTGTQWSNSNYGPFSSMSRVRVRDIRDGTSQTLAVGEQAALTTPTDVGAYWAFGKRGLSLSGTEYPSNSSNASLASATLAAVFRSYHEGGVFFLFCDGQVRFLSENIDIGTYRALSTIANNELVDDEDY
jgi:uncharacterized protein DUF1559